LGHQSVFVLTKGKSNSIWAGTFESGLYNINLQTQKLTNYQTPSILSNKVRALHCDRKGNIWVGTFDNGLSVLNPEGKILYQLQQFGNIEHPKGGFDEIRVIYEDSKGQIWVGLLNQPLYKFDTVRHNLISQSIYSENHAGKNAEGNFSIAEDKFGNMWLATHGMGLFYTNKFKNKIGHIGGKAHLSILSAQNIVTAIVVDKQGNTWAGTDGNGLLKTDKNGNSKTFNVKNGLSSNAIHHLALDKDGILWISTWGGGVMSFNTVTNAIKTFVHSNSNPFSLLGDNSKVVLPDDSIVWIGTHGDGIAILDKLSGKIYNYKNNKKYPFDLKEPAWINHIFKDSQKRIWVSTCFGLYLIKNNTLYGFHAGDKKSHLANDYVNMVVEDTKGKIWIIGELCQTYTKAD
jgi:ligand-binding sensor domain-containing protein